MSTLVDSTVNVEGPHFGRLTPRMAAWREELMETPQSVCVERAMLTTETYRQHQGEPMVLRRALMLKNVLENMSIFIGVREPRGPDHARVRDGLGHRRTG